MDTICAIATAPGGALGVVRVSGDDAIRIVDTLFRAADGKPLVGRQGYRLVFGTLLDDDGSLLDEVLVSLFHAPHSYTGEESVEISCHASAYIMQQTLRLLVAHGCRMALPGEYTQRAFLNGKMDLSRAEAVADVIAASTAASHRLAMNQLRGGFSIRLRELRDRLLHFASLMELELDFSDHEDVEFADRTQLALLAQELDDDVSRLVESFSIGNAVRRGVPVAIVGAPNSGKSTLLNALAEEERAIVSDVRGTTRDTIEDTVVIGGILFRFIDTAGIHDTEDRLEQLGIERTYQAVQKAEVVILLTDLTIMESVDERLLPLLDGKTVLTVYNKADIAHDIPFAALPDGSLLLSAKTSEGLPELRRRLLEAAAIPTLSENDVIVTNARHQEALLHALEALRRVRAGLADGLPTDLVAEDVRQCIHHLSDIVGDVTTDDVLTNIFSHFCIGK